MIIHRLLKTKTLVGEGSEAVDENSNETPEQGETAAVIMQSVSIAQVLLIQNCFSKVMVKIGGHIGPNLLTRWWRFKSAQCWCC